MSEKLEDERIKNLVWKLDCKDKEIELLKEIIARRRIDRKDFEFAEVGRLKTENEELRDEIAELTAENEKLKAKNEKWKRENDIWEKQSLSKLAKNNQGLREGIENLKVVNSELREEIADGKEQILKFSGLLKKKDEEIEKLQGEVEELRKLVDSDVSDELKSIWGPYEAYRELANSGIQYEENYAERLKEVIEKSIIIFSKLKSEIAEAKKEIERLKGVDVRIIKRVIDKHIDLEFISNCHTGKKEELARAIAEALKSKQEKKDIKFDPKKHILCDVCGKFWDKDTDRITGNFCPNCGNNFEG